MNENFEFLWSEANLGTAIEEDFCEQIQAENESEAMELFKQKHKLYYYDEVFVFEVDKQPIDSVDDELNEAYKKVQNMIDEHGIDYVMERFNKFCLEKKGLK